MNTLSNSVFWSLAAILLLSCFQLRLGDIDLSCASGKRHGETSSSMRVSGKALAVWPPTGCLQRV